MKATITRLAIVIAGAFGLAAPAHAQGANPRGVNPTHYQCYKIDAPAKQVTVKSLRDQFGTAGPVTLGAPLFLCAPTDKNGVAAKDKTTHYLCYQDDGVKPVNKKAQITNQFGEMGIAITTPAMLCVPSLKKLSG
ncbi:MAG: hypothetical protein QOK01_3364 [Alphaproteobacteria bacterium]|jgi:hypothetical protein|nr:hypothetical protein [Alphaproteobacteria bacterium]